MDAVRQIILQLDPEGVQQRRTSSLVRRVYRNKGPQYLIHIDGYDKLKKYGFCIHGGIDGFSKKILWLKVGHTNNDPVYVARYFMEYVKEIKGVPRCVRMDRGTENILIEDIMIAFREHHTDSMAHHSVLYGSSNHNQPIESWWRTLRRTGIQHWMDFFAHLESEGEFEVGDEMSSSCLRYCFQHIIQANLDEIKDEWNSHRMRSSQSRTAGVPNVLYTHPGLYDAVDYKTDVAESDITEVAALCKQPLPRGCSDAVRHQLNILTAELKQEESYVPLTLDAAKELYLAIRAQLH